jgi:outer membrane protein assembly factor BamB
MLRLFVLVELFALTLLSPTATEAEDIVRRVPLNPIKFEKTDWPWWRGAERNGHGSTDQTPPLSWDAEKNVVWKAPVPGRGHGSPIVVGNRVFLATAADDTHVQSIICYDRGQG